jgi:hypothetical protein
MPLLPAISLLLVQHEFASSQMADASGYDPARARIGLRREGTLGFLSGILIVAAAGMIRVCGAIRRRDRAQVHNKGVTFSCALMIHSDGLFLRS